MKRFAILLSCSFLWLMGTVSPLTAQDKSQISKSVKNFTLQDYRGKAWKLDEFKENKLIVLAILGTECPLVKLYGPRLAELHQKYKSKGVAFVGINPNMQDSITEIAAYARRHKIEFPILKDLGNKIADRLGAKRTPEVFVLDDKRVVRYRGRIDDQFGVGYIRDEATQHELKNALDELLAGKTVSRPVTKAVGCIIGRVHAVKKDSTITYSKHISRILQKRCVECHRQGEIAPFALTKYKEVAGWAEMIAEVVDEGRMPPWHANPKHGKFSNDRRLSKSEKDQIFAWVKNGAPQGDAKDLPKPRKFVTGWQLPRKPDRVLNIRSTPFRVPASGVVRYQYLVMDPGFKEDKWIQAAQLLPDNRAVVHHILAFAVGSNPRNALREVQGGAGGFLFGYVPGQVDYTYPQGMAKRIRAGEQLVFQVHYTPIGTEQFDQSKLGLVFADPKDVNYEIITRSAFNQFFLLRPGKARQKLTAKSRRIPPGSLLLGFSPHMHLRGQAFRYEARYPDGTSEILLDVPNFDFNWQTIYRLAEPIKLKDGAYIQCTGWFDNSEDNLNNPNPKSWVRWGEQTWDEMLIGYYGYAVPRKRTGQPKRNPRTTKKKRPSSTSIEGIFESLDKNGDGKLTRAEARLPEQQFNLADRDRNSEITLEELRRALGGSRIN